MHRASAALIVALCAGAVSAPAQMRVSIGAGVGTIRTEAGSDFSSASLSPAVRFTTPSLTAALSGTVASLPNGVWSGYGRLHLWGVTPRLAQRLRLGADGSLEGTSRSGGNGSTAAHGIGELLWTERRWGVAVGAGPSAGWIANAPSVVALHTRARAWWRPSSTNFWQLSVEPTHFFGDWFTDVSAATSVSRGPVTLSLSADTRLSSVYGSTAAGSAFVQLFVARGMALELGGGSYLRDPYQGFPRGRFFSFGIRVGSARPVSAVPRQSWGPLVPRARGDSVAVQFRFRDARTVAIAGNWDGWQTHSLRSVGSGLWEGTFVLPRGLYHFNLLVDSQTWVVPSGVATVPDELGGMVAVLLVR